MLSVVMRSSSTRGDVVTAAVGGADEAAGAAAEVMVEDGEVAAAVVLCLEWKNMRASAASDKGDDDISSLSLESMKILKEKQDSPLHSIY
jgi:hypothetical protein